jgi:hypothetical protein
MFISSTEISRYQMAHYAATISRSETKKRGSYANGGGERSWLAKFERDARGGHGSRATPWAPLTSPHNNVLACLFGGGLSKPIPA